MIEKATLRPAQAAILDYRDGPMAISAVPGAGKTFILEHLAARLIARDDVKPSEILILTYMRSAALNVKRRIARTLAEHGRMAYGLQALTIHAFALSVVRRARGLDAEEAPLVILSEGEARRILLAGLEAWLAAPGNAMTWDSQRGGREDPVMDAVRVAGKAIAEAKHYSLSPEDVARAVGATRPEIPYLYRHYLAAQAALGASDYDDLIHQAVHLLTHDADLLAWHLRRIRFVLEDEAQDSTPAQQRLLTLLTSPAHGGEGNLIRVGDANQAIMTSFTHNDPRYFRAFCEERDADGRHFPMTESSRSAWPILKLANRLVDVVREDHPDAEVRRTFTGAHILPATAGRLNPAATAPPSWTFYAGSKKDEFRAREEIGVLDQVRAYLRANPTRTAAVLVRTGALKKAFQTRADQMGIALAARAHGSIDTRGCLGLVQHVLAFLRLPATDQAAAFLAVVREWGRLRRVAWAAWPALEAFVSAQGAEALLYPEAGLPPRKPPEVDAADYAGALDVARALRRCLAARHLPAVELLPMIAHGLLEDVQATTIAAKAAIVAGRQRAATSGGQAVPSGRDPLEALQAELREVIRALGDQELVPPPAELAEPEGGRLAILTLHASKGMEFDAVWLPSLGYFFGQKGHFPWHPEAVEIWDKEAFMIELALRPPDQRPATAEEAEAAAKRLAVAENLRLLYVGITRAQRELHLSASGFDEAKATPPHVAALAAECDRRTP